MWTTSTTASWSARCWTCRDSIGWKSCAGRKAHWRKEFDRRCRQALLAQALGNRRGASSRPRMAASSGSTCAQGVTLTWLTTSFCACPPSPSCAAVMSASSTSPAPSQSWAPTCRSGRRRTIARSAGSAHQDIGHPRRAADRALRRVEVNIIRSLIGDDSQPPDVVPVYAQNHNFAPRDG